MPEDVPPPQAGLRAGPLHGRPAFQQALREAFVHAATAGVRELWCCDLDFAQWPLGDPVVVQALERWAYGHRKLVLLASRFDEVPRRHARWVAWRRTWSHVVTCRALPEVRADDVPCLWWGAPVAQVRLIDTERYRGVVETSASELLRSREMLDELWLRSIDAFPATTLGL